MLSYKQYLLNESFQITSNNTHLQEKLIKSIEAPYNKQYVPNGILDIYENPTTKEFNLSYEERFGYVRGIIVDENTCVFFTPNILHGTVRDLLDLTKKNVVSIVVYGKKNVDVQVTDNTRNTKWFHNPNTEEYIRSNTYLKKLKIANVSFFDEDIFGSWNDMNIDDVEDWS